jgi:hypothetical protein
MVGVTAMPASSSQGETLCRSVALVNAGWTEIEFASLVEAACRSASIG